jgi:hypothetical protein
VSGKEYDFDAKAAPRRTPLTVLLLHLGLRRRIDLVFRGIHRGVPAVLVLVVAEHHRIWIDCHFAAVVRIDEIRELTVVAETTIFAIVPTLLPTLLL